MAVIKIKITITHPARSSPAFSESFTAVQQVQVQDARLGPGTNFLVIRSKTLMIPSMAPVARYFPSLEAARLRVNLLLLSR